MLYDLIKTLLFKLDAEKAHRITINALKLAPTCFFPKTNNYPELNISLFGCNFANPVGLAAGFDKNAEAIPALFALGFGFVEAGTVTIKPQTGNPRPRIFREPSQNAVINRMGFPNLGADIFKKNIEKIGNNKGILGINIGMNKDQTDAALDYTELVRIFGNMANYLTINISSPNTVGLRNLQEPSVLRELLTKVLHERSLSCPIKRTPILVKLAPDLNDDQLKGIANVLMEVRIDGVILTNTTLDRPEYLPSGFVAEKGGLSGAPLRDKSTQIIGKFYNLTNGKIPIIGVGGISSARDAYDKIRAGASLIQIYSGMIFHGPNLIHDINSGLCELLKQDGFENIAQAVGADYKNVKYESEESICA